MITSISENASNNDNIGDGDDDDEVKVKRNEETLDSQQERQNHQTCSHPCRV